MKVRHVCICLNPKHWGVEANRHQENAVQSHRKYNGFQVEREKERERDFVSEE